MNGFLSRAILLAMVLPVFSCAPVVSPRAGVSRADKVSGFYEGSLHSRQYGEVRATVNLINEGGRLTGLISTPLGDFPVSHDSLTANQVTFIFTLDDGEVGTVRGQWNAEEIRGSWTLSTDGGEMLLRRVGPARAPVVAATPTLDLSTTQWREDLHHLASQLPQKHGNAFHQVSPQEMEDSIRALHDRLPWLQGHQVFAAMGRIVAMVGDGHTYLELPGTFSRYPIRLYYFGDTLRITHATAGHEQLLGARILAIGETPLEKAEALVARQVARENEQYLRKELPAFLTFTELLHAHGVIHTPGPTDWTLQLPSGERVVVTLTPATPDHPMQLISAARAVPLYRKQPDDLWYTFLPGSGTLYVGFRGYPARPEFQAFFNQVLSFAQQEHVERLVIDLRENQGGDFTKGRDLLIAQLINHRLNQQGRLYVAISRFTFSAAMTNAADLLQQTNATLVGEPTGARPNGWQEKGQFTLPNSHLNVSVSTQYYRFLEEDLPAVMPHKFVPLTWEHFQEGRDPVMEWIETQPLPGVE